MCTHKTDCFFPGGSLATQLFLSVPTSAVLQVQRHQSVLPLKLKGMTKAATQGGQLPSVSHDWRQDDDTVLFK